MAVEGLRIHDKMLFPSLMFLTKDTLFNTVSKEMKLDRVIEISFRGHSRS